MGGGVCITHVHCSQPQDDPFDFATSADAKIVYHSFSGKGLREFDLSKCTEPILRKRPTLDSEKGKKEKKAAQQSPDLLESDHDESESHDELMALTKVREIQTVVWSHTSRRSCVTSPTRTSQISDPRGSANARCSSRR